MPGPISRTITPARAPIAGAKTASGGSATATSTSVLRSLSGTKRIPILKERLFGLTNLEGNHGEDVKERYYYLQATPTSSYLQFLYKYPHAAYPYDQLVAENGRRSRLQPEYELIDTGIFGENRYHDIFVEYAKATSEEMLVRITAWNRGPEPARLHVLPTLWFRNRWSWGDPYDMPRVASVDGAPGTKVVEMQDYHYGVRWLLAEGSPELLFTNNETNTERLYNEKNRTPYVKDAFHRYLIAGDKSAVNPALIGHEDGGALRCRDSSGEKLDASPALYRSQSR